MVEKYFGTLPANTNPAGTPGSEFNWQSITSAASAKATSAYAQHDLATGLSAGLDLVRSVDQYINVTAPFKLAKTVEQNPAAKDQLAAILYNCAEALRIASVLLSPAMPQKMAQVWQSWHCTPPTGATLAQLCEFGGKHALKPGQTIAKGEVLFMRADAAEAAPA
jgi:methionyl-tRNA synthetase